MMPVQFGLTVGVDREAARNEFKRLRERMSDADAQAKIDEVKDQIREMGQDPEVVFDVEEYRFYLQPHADQEPLDDVQIENTLDTYESTINARLDALKKEHPELADIPDDVRIEFSYQPENRIVMEGERFRLRNTKDLSAEVRAQMGKMIETADIQWQDSQRTTVPTRIREFDPVALMEDRLPPRQPLETFIDRVFQTVLSEWPTKWWIKGHDETLGKGFEDGE